MIGVEQGMLLSQHLYETCLQQGTAVLSCNSLLTFDKCKTFAEYYVGQVGA